LVYSAAPLHACPLELLPFPTRRSSDLIVLLHLLGLAGPQQPMIDEHAGELIAHGAVHERRCHRGIDPAAQAADHLGRADLLLDQDRKSTRLNSSHVKISYAVFCLKKKK